MKKLLYMPVVLLLFLSVSLAQDDINPQKRIESGSTPLMSKVLNLLILKANTLDLMEKQREELDLIQEKYVFPLAIIEAEHNISRMKVVNIMRDPNFDPAEAKKASETLKEIALEMSFLVIDGLVEIRKVIGLKNYIMIASRLTIK